MSVILVKLGSKYTISEKLASRISLLLLLLYPLCVGPWDMRNNYSFLWSVSLFFGRTRTGTRERERQRKSEGERERKNRTFYSKKK